MTIPALPYSSPAQLADALRLDGFALVRPQDVAQLAGCTLDQLAALAPSWEHLELDHYLKDGGRYRRRRHSCFVQTGEELVQAPHRAHWQPLEYNALHGGMRRMFEPVEPAIVSNPAWTQLLRALGDVCTQAKAAPAWFVEAHQFRIDTANGIGRPTPEGAHRDGVDFVAVLLVGREGIKGGETRVFEADGPRGQRFTMLAPWTLLLLDDAKVIHESTPIQPVAGGGHRDTLVLTWRANAFQGDDQAAYS
jgi:hypothetical protein